MFSVILYGRNDSHGYNLHKRAAISFNALAEVMSDPDDEILFVDYNTPDDHPTFPEAIHDTLTDKAKKVMRVLRVRPDQHVRHRLKTHLVALEAQSRNVALRRSNPRNRWILYTNTDMLLVPRNEKRIAERHPGRDPRRLLPGAALRDPRDAVGGGVRPPRSGGQPRQAARLVGPLPSQPGRPQLHADEVRRAGRLPGGVARGHVRHPRLRRGHDPGLALQFEPGGAAGALSRPGRHADRQAVRLSLRPHPRRRRQQQGPRHADERPGPLHLERRHALRAGPGRDLGLAGRRDRGDPARPRHRLSALRGRPRQGDRARDGAVRRDQPRMAALRRSDLRPAAHPAVRLRPGGDVPALDRPDDGRDAAGLRQQLRQGLEGHGLHRPDPDPRGVRAACRPTWRASSGRLSPNSSRRPTFLSSSSGSPPRRRPSPCAPAARSGRSTRSG